MSTNKPTLVWFRDDLRVGDNPALHHAVQSGQPIIAVYILDEQSDGLRKMGGAQKWFLHHALESLSSKLKELGATLQVHKGAANFVIQQIVKEESACSVHWNRRYGKAEIEIDSALKTWLQEIGVEAHSYLGNLLHEPYKMKTGSGGPYRVYSPFWRALEAKGEPRAAHPAPKAIIAHNPSASYKDTGLSDLGLLPNRPNWASGWNEIWQASEDGAHEALHRFLEDGLSDYSVGRDFPAKKHFSRLSPFFRFGMISPYQVWHALRAVEATQQLNPKDCLKFLKEVAWREFSYHLLFHFPDLGWKNHQPKFDDFPWRTDAAADLTKWQKGQTGYPIVDAGMRELWQTGFMHNRVRMVVGSFLVKHLLIDWRKGESWFWDTLVDGDPANNTASWQWIAGCGADAAPYFRVFNPMLQGTKFDPGGEYVRKFVPELAALPDKYLNSPWETPSNVLKQCGITLGETYPHPIVEHAGARDRALAAFKDLKKAEE